ncbi:MAG TPA: hypothetical protein VMV83_16325 [Rectinemataceae bacterium]|nr:hypothetical protein [Rectinemataceae bacterium]
MKLPHDLRAALGRGETFRQAPSPPRVRVPNESEAGETLARGRGRPKGSKTKTDDTRRGRTSGRHPRPDEVELLRQAAMVAFLRAFPALARTLSESELDRLEHIFEVEITGALKRQ